LYVVFIEHALRLLRPHGQLGFLCPGTWTKNVYGGSIREALTSQGHLKTIIDFSDVDSFEKSADAYPHFFVFEKGSSGATKIFSMTGTGQLRRAGKAVSRRFSPSPAPLVLSRNDKVAQTLKRAREKFPNLEHAGCCVRVGSATGCNEVFLGRAKALPVEHGRLLPFVNAGSIQDASVRWSGTNIVNVFDRKGTLVRLAHFPRLAAYLRKHKKRLKARAKASKSKIWWRSIDSLHPDWYRASKLLVVDISASPVIGLDNKGYCAGGGVYQIKSENWPLKDLLVLLSAGVLGLFVAGLSAGAATGFHRFQKAQISAIRASYVDFTNPDEWLAPPGSAHRETMIQTTRTAMRFLGLSRMGLISMFDLCKFSYGYSRVENGPKLFRHDRWMPVRLNLFPKVQVGHEARHPVYVLEQSNEAYYFNLDEALVRAWLAQIELGCADSALLDEFQENFAAAMLASADVMSGYLEEHDRKSDPTIYTMTYALLHSYSHYIMQGIQQFSGLDLGSMGEYLFPCDLALVVYRNGMTLDLGDLSALWRNHHEAFLSYLRNYPTSLGCNLGNLCMTKGGACPDCIMIPEVICLTANKYLSRSTLIGRGRPDFIVGEQRLKGYLQYAFEHAQPNE
jgi:hypothetical protein